MSAEFTWRLHTLKTTEEDIETIWGFCEIDVKNTLTTEMTHTVAHKLTHI